MWLKGSMESLRFLGLEHKIGYGEEHSMEYYSESNQQSRSVAPEFAALGLQKYDIRCGNTSTMLPVSASTGTQSNRFRIVLKFLCLALLGFGLYMLGRYPPSESSLDQE